LRAFSVLVSNFAGRKELPAQHGLSLFIRMDNTDILFDTGADDLFLHNARFMNLPLININYAVVSHFHYDHIGGLPHLSRHFSMTNKVCEVICAESYEMPILPAIKKRSPDYGKEINDNISIIKTSTEKSDGESIIELSVVAGKTMFIGCGHSGISKMVETALKKVGSINTLAGGFHNMSQSSNELENTAKKLARIGIKKVVLLHCTTMKFIRHLEDNGIECKVGYVGHSYNI
jgi:7,8-dihydropterin-6-yl-methyl-4-(beta-D-ribofuranosyl)aminobenzene 5'-phosphate synthase